MSRRSRLVSRRDRRNERGAAMVLGAIFFAFLALPLCALAVDTARWWVETHRIQAAADAASTAGVTFMPEDFAKAEARALEVAAQNGYTAGGGTTITVEGGAKPTQLKVTISQSVDNFFASSFGIHQSTITRGSVADFNGPAPMGSPCNTFGNEPAGSATLGPQGSVLKSPPHAICSTNPQFWGAIAGPETWKDQGSQFETRKCGGGEDGCASSANGAANEEYDPRGFIYMIRVSDAAVGQSIKLQLYDPAYVDAGSGACNAGPTGTFAATENYRYPYATTDAHERYKNAANAFCSGDSDNGSRRFGGESATITSFALREPVDTLNPFAAPAHQPAQCTKQFPGYRDTGADSALRNLDAGNGPDFKMDMARVFHQWVDLCTFTPSRAGDWYLQVRNNVDMPNGSITLDSTGAYAGNPAVVAQVGDDPHVKGNGNNMFGIRAISNAPAGAVSVSSFEKMRIYANADSATTTFNLVRVVPAAANKKLVVSFFDVGEATGGSPGSVQLLPPAESNLTTVNGCIGDGVTDGTLSNCTITGITSASYNGKLQFLRVPIPSTYTCESVSAGGCWWRAMVSFPGSRVTDATTWTARVEGEPIRIIE
ncbi:pilus assembly protein TadG-related protein [Nocardioides sp.]|uniref:pilus assembly protein TadG-related protein n=1 Tax=Nocardioides sp. TaxID=35761 RepID=UPI002B86E9DC|nr:pilus assembly protein TadG-related protein [Nocardioides sp.]HXH81286.1 pilus assembly protein TadG-related protein [Nocardioides sp.]